MKHPGQEAEESDTMSHHETEALKDRVVASVVNSGAAYSDLTALVKATVDAMLADGWTRPNE